MLNMHFQIASLFYMILVLIAFYSKKRVKNYETKIFSYMSWINLIGIILDIILVTYGYYDPYNMMVYVLNKFYLSYIVVWIALFSLYLLKITLSPIF